VSQTDTLFCQRTITDSSKGQRINQEVISMSVLVVQKVVRNFWKSLRWARKCLVQTEVNVAHKKLHSLKCKLGCVEPPHKSFMS